MQSIASSHGRFVWYELMTTDVPGAIEFYGKVFGWTTETWGPPSPDAYQMWKTSSGRMIGGIMNLPQQARDMGAPPHWIGNLSVTDIEAAMVSVAEQGGTIYKAPFDVPTVGRVAIVADSTGATLAVVQFHTEAPGHTETPGQGEVSWNELMTSDLDKAFSFYEALGGWSKTGSMDMGPMGTYQMWGLGEQSLGGMMLRAPEMPVSSWLYYVQVDSVQATIDTALAAGGRLVHGPQPVPGGNVAIMVDPQGGHFAAYGG